MTDIWPQDKRLIVAVIADNDDASTFCSASNAGPKQHWVAKVARPE
ncbi:MAG: hypothetical protein ACKVHO_01935 [Verrucomicrobiia bacterium]